MDVSTIVTIGLLIIAIVVFFAIKNRRTASSIMKENTNVLPLMQQKGLQIKVTGLQKATQDNPAANERLAKLVSAYKTNQITLEEYNHKLDNMIMQLEVEL